MNRSENIAKLIIENVIPGCNMHFREDQSSGEYDFDLIYKTGSVAAVEVTASMDEILARDFARLRDERYGGMFVPAVKCELDWWVHPLPGADFRKIRRHVDDYLSAVEGLGLTDFFALRASVAPPVFRIYRDLQIEAGSVVRWAPPRRIGLALPSREGGLVISENVKRAIEAETTKLDNRRKLRASCYAETHLFIYVDAQNFLPWISLVEGEVPGQPPVLPPEITHVWAAADAYNGDAFRVWRADQSGWQNFGTVAGYPSVSD